MAKMAANGSKLTAKQEAAILALMTNQGVDNAARAIGIGPRTLYRWLNEPAFDKAYRQARRAAFGQGTARLQQASGAAVTSVLKIMVDPNAPASTRLRAADLVLTHGSKAIELEDIEVRLTEVERSVEASKQR